MVNALLEFIISTIKPTSLQWKGIDVKYENKIIFPKYVSFEAGLMIDLLFYGYLFSASLTWFGITVFYEWIYWYFVGVVCLFFGIFVGLISKYYGKYKKFQ